VLSGNRNFEARIHQSVKANFLMSPPLVVAFALAGRVDVNLSTDPIGTGSDGRPVYLRDIWPTPEEIAAFMPAAFDPATYERLYSDIANANPMWSEIQAVRGEVYAWDKTSTYIQEPPFFEASDSSAHPPRDVRDARALAIFGDSVTTDHISPAGAIKPTTPAGQYLLTHGVKIEDFNSYGARRGNHQVMVRGTFANVRIQNLMVPGVEGGFTIHQPTGERTTIYDAAMQYEKEGVPLLVFAGQEYGTGSSRDWAAKGTRLLGVRAVIAQSFERIHRSNLVGMGVLPCQFEEGTNAPCVELGRQRDVRPGGIGNRHPAAPAADAASCTARNGTSENDSGDAAHRNTDRGGSTTAYGGILPYVAAPLLARRDRQSPRAQPDLSSKCTKSIRKTAPSSVALSFVSIPVGNVTPERVGIGEHLFADPAPLFDDPADDFLTLADLERPRMQQRSIEREAFAAARVEHRIDAARSSEKRRLMLPDGPLPRIADDDLVENRSETAVAAPASGCRSAS
jgi:aconitate hydratase